MDTGHTVATLKSFEREIADDFNLGRIRAPIHLSGGNEDHLIRIFKDIHENDFVCTTWRSHYHCLLKGVPVDVLRADILAGRSISLNYPEHRIISSAIVGGVLPIGVGLAMGVKRRGGFERVWVFVGDMTALTGAFHECTQYAQWKNLPITFVVENNGKSVCTETMTAWGAWNVLSARHIVLEYNYELPWPHSGAGVRINF